MHQIKTAALLMTSGALLLPAAPALANAQEERDYLPSDIVVTGERAGYAVDDGSTGTKTPTPLIDVPQTVDVITADQLEDQSIRQLSEALRYVPGVSMETGEGNRDEVFIRGQESTADFYLDGLRDDAQYYRSLYNVERIEVLKGPNALIFGRGGGGGAINRVAKHADLSDVFANFSASADTFSAFALSGDINQPLTDTLAGLISATYEEFGNDRDFYSGRFIGFSPTVTAQLGPDTQLTAHYTYDDDRRLADRGIPSLGGGPLTGFDDTLFGDPDFNLSRTKVHIARARLDHEFSSALSANVAVQFADYDKLYANIVPGSTNGTTVALSGYENLTDRRNWIGQANLVWRTDTGPVTHMVLAGVEAANQRTDDTRRLTEFATAAGPERSVQVALTEQLAIPQFTLTAPSRARDSQLDTLSAYVQDQISVGEHLQLIAGLRWDRFDITTTDRITATTLQRTDELLSPRFGIVVKPAHAVSFYASYAESFLPQSGDQFVSLSGIAATLEPEKFENVELGAKWLIRPDLFLTAAVFRLDRSRTTAADPLVPGNLLLTGKTRTKGIELNLVGKITPRWQANLSYTLLDGEIRSDTTAAPAGTRLEQLPKHHVALWNRYQATTRIGFGLGVIYQDEQFASVSNAVTLPDYWRVDAAVYYEISERAQLQVNVENLFDETYYPSAHGDNNIQPAAPLSARIGVRLKL